MFHTTDSLCSERNSRVRIPSSAYVKIKYLKRHANPYKIKGKFGSER